MKSGVIVGISLILLFMAMFTLGFDVKPAVAEDVTILICADGSIDPPTANITSADNITYVFTGNNYQEIFVNRSNIVVDGGAHVQGYTLQGTGSGIGIGVTSFASNVTIKDVEISEFEYGIWINASSTLNNICENFIRNNIHGIWLANSSNNIICHNNLLDNTVPASVEAGDVNVWDDGYPSGGNYWSEYTGTDANQDGIGDTPYIIDENNRDRYPLIHPYGYVFTPDVNDDGIVDVFDLRKCAKAFGSKPGDPNWHPATDSNKDSRIDIFDLRKIAKHYGEHL